MWAEEHSIRRHLMRTISLIAVCLVFHLTLLAQGASTAMQTIRLSVQPVNTFSVGRSAVDMTVARVGDQIVGRAEDRFALRIRTAGRKISASINAPLPKGSRLWVRMGDAVGTSSGQVEFEGTTSTADLVTDLRPGSVTNESIEYTWTTVASTEPLTSEMRTIVYTLTD